MRSRYTYKYCKLCSQKLETIAFFSDVDKTLQQFQQFPKNRVISRKETAEIPAENCSAGFSRFRTTEVLITHE